MMPFIYVFLWGGGGGGGALEHLYEELRYGACHPHLIPLCLFPPLSNFVIDVGNV